MDPQFLQLGEENIQAYSQWLTEGKLFERTEFLSPPPVGQTHLDDVKVEELADPVAGPDDVLLDADKRTAYLPVLPSLLVGNVAGILEVMFSRTKARRFASLLSVFTLFVLGSVTMCGGMTTQSMPSAIS